MDNRPKIRAIDVLLFDGVNALDVAGPVQAFDAARFADRAVYKLRYVSVDGTAVRASCGMLLGADGALRSCDPDHDLLVPGGDGIDDLLGNEAVLAAVRERLRADSGARVISICSGALVLAEAGVLDGGPATTHWSREQDVRRFAQIDWDLDRLFVQRTRVFTSAGVTTGIDLALSIIRSDCGNATALRVARELVVQLHRTGNQSQYAMHLAGQFTKENTLGQLIEAIITNPKQPWTLDRMARESVMNPRTLSRRFQDHLATSPAQFVERVRVDHARSLLEASLPAKIVAAEAGFGDLQRMRRAFQRRYGVSFAQYAAAFRDQG
ncbi:GlxA family transcriptional regulator [Palleronia caenipelagi]|uniref:Helix-turn-helix domain-containing protein n=1 Tax=Palleronia caenipelagi TaxID=2489174 RepID=A0A547PT35_9RHOB|nr:DJ-1/PfpI family protein [Palleronia caenipelagi]TRD17312.1 helix-turn-helix domain-containing protein [Palleronia caenipelagi]